MSDEVKVEVRRSARRVRTVSASRQAGVIVVCIPHRFTRTQETQWVDRMVARLLEQEARRAPSQSGLEERAARLDRKYLAGMASPASVRWVDNQNSRWGSCTPRDGSIRISTRLRRVPSWVLDYVLVHELAHLLEAGHGPRFWELLSAYPRTERARGYLEGLGAAGYLKDYDDVIGGEEDV